MRKRRKERRGRHRPGFYWGPGTDPSSAGPDSTLLTVMAFAVAIAVTLIVCEIVASAVLR